MSRFTAIDLSGLTPPDIIETVDFETVVAEMRDDLVARFPAIENVIDLESEPARKLIEVFAYRETLLRARINDGARAVLLASSYGTNLDHLGALFGTPRETVADADGNAVAESDARYRRRLQLAPEAFSVAGPEGAYQYHALTAAGWARDATAITPAPGVVRVTMLKTGAEPLPTADELGAVQKYLGDEAVRPLTDTVHVLGPEVIPVAIAAVLTLYPGPDATVVLNRATSALSAWLETNRMLGSNLPRSAIFAKLHQEGVRSVDLLSPGGDVVTDDTQVYSVSGLSITAATTRDE